MSDPDNHALDRLCAYCRIQADYYDIWGNHHVAPRASRLALLRAMGIAVDGEADAAAALERLQTRDWLSVAPPARIVFENDAIHVPLSLPAPLPAAEAVEWRLRLEHGGELSGHLAALHAGETGRVEHAEYQRCDAQIQAAAPPGYHRLELWTELGPLAEIALIVCPRQCYQPPALANNGRLWGLSVQLYGLRSRRNWGIGDFTDLKTLVDIAADAGAAMIGINPLHALFTDQPEQASPYSPSNRAALNVLYLDVEAIAEFSASAEARAHVAGADFQAQLRDLRDAARVDYSRVAAAKLGVLRMLHAQFRGAPGGTRDAGFRAFLGQAGEAMHLHAVFEALQAHFHARDGTVWGWQQWPESYRDPRSPAVTAFAEAHAEEVEFFAYLQWNAELQLAEVGARCLQLQTPIGLYQDLAVGPNAGGAEIWIHTALYAKRMHVGAPPDEFNLKGQDWGLPPMIPSQLAAAGYAPFIGLMRAAMRHAGALRIDHVMGLARLFWVPADSGAAAGAYVGYPLWDLLGIVALESRRQRCLVIGEDLGTVPDEVRAAMSAFDILSYRLLYFERTHGDEFAPPEHYPERALVTVATHDLPTLRGYWTGADLALRDSLSLYPSEEAKTRQASQRGMDRERLLRALERGGLLTPDMQAHGTAAHDLPPALAQALNAYLARSPARLLGVQPEDIFEQAEQVNVPSTIEHQYPNWRHKIMLDLEDWRDDPRLQAFAAALREPRGNWRRT